MKQTFNIGLRVKILLLVSIGLLFSYGSAAVIRAHSLKKEYSEVVERSGYERVEMVSATFANLLLAQDFGNVESLAERIAEMPDVQQIRILDNTGKVVISRSQAGLAEDRVLVFSAPIATEGKVIGKAELSVSSERPDAATRSGKRNIIATITLSGFVLGLMIYFAVTKWIVQPLLRLSHAADQLAMGNYSAALPLAPGDEMGRLINAFALMRERRGQNEARTSAIFAHFPDACVLLDAAGNIIDWNDRAVEIWGYGKSEVQGKNFSIVMPPPELGLNEGYQKCYQKSENILGVIRVVVGQRRDGSHFPLELRTSALDFENEHAYLVSARDISKRKMDEEKLRQAMREVEAANTAKSAFLSNMSHEIRTPMNSIIGMTRLALMKKVDKKQRDYLTKIDFSAQHLLNLINDILDFSKIEARQLELDQIDFELKLLFENLRNQLAHSAKDKGLFLRLEMDAGSSLPLRGDPLRLLQILLNYTSNAIKFTERGEVCVIVKVLDETEQDVNLRFEVHDTGIGLKQNEIEHLFQPFHQADVSTTRKYGGTGLGLAISKELAGLMGGKVGVQSEPGIGSTFWFEVRLQRGNTPDEKSGFSVPGLNALDGVSILLVEDNLFNQQVAQEMLREMGASIKVANHGQEALDMLAEQSFDCVLLDVQMPVMDGFEAARKIRAHATLASTYIIAMTANAGKEDRERCFAAGMNDFISKPVFFEQLYSAISRGIMANKLGRIDERGHILEEQDRKIEQSSSVVAGAASRGGVDQSAVIDLSVLGKMMGSDPEKIRKFANKFVQSARQGMVEIEAALAQENWQQLAALGHRGKSPARTVGAEGYANLCLMLEQFKHGGSVEKGQAVVQQMKELLSRIEEQINCETSCTLPDGQA